MKKVLLATTILGMTAGFAAAEIKFTGEATLGFAQNGTRGDGWCSGGSSTAAAAASNVGAAGATANTAISDDVVNPYSHFTLSIAATGESDSGLSYGANLRARSGTAYTFGNEDGFTVRGNGAIELREVFVSGNFGKVTYLANGYKSYKADAATSEVYDLQYEHTIAGFSIGLRSNLNGTIAADTAVANAHAGRTSLKLGYTVGAITLGGTFDEVGSLWGLSAAYKLNDMLTFTATTDNAQESSLAVAYTGANGISAGLKGISFAGATSRVEVSAGYKANGWDIKASADNRAIARWSVSGSYDLGGGLSAEAGANYTNDMYLGAKMKF
jgi:hypothetical protein